MATLAAADPAPPSRSYYEAYTKKVKAGNRFQDAVFVDRGALRVAHHPNKPPLPHLPTEKRAIDRDEYARFLEAQLAAAGQLLARFEAREGVVQQQIDNAARTCAEAAAGARAEEAARVERRIVDLEARLAASETNLRRAEEASKAAEQRVDDACALVRELASGPRLRAAEDRASAACARVADVEKALHAALRSLGEKGLTNLLEDDDEETTPLAERMAQAEGAVAEAQAQAMNAEALAERLAKRVEDAERTSRELAEAAATHEDQSTDAVVEAVANLERATNERLEALEARAHRPPPSPIAMPESPPTPIARPASPVLSDEPQEQSTPAAAKANQLLKEQLGLEETPDASIASMDASDGTTLAEDDDAMARAGRDLDDARAVAEAVADEAVLRAEFAEQEACLLRERAATLCHKLRQDADEPPSYDEHTTHHGGDFVEVESPRRPARLDHASPVRRSAPVSPKRAATKSPKKTASPPRRKARSYAESPPPQLDDVEDGQPPLPPHLRQYEELTFEDAAPARPKALKKKKKVLRRKVARRPAAIETRRTAPPPNAAAAAERARARVLASRRTGATHREPIGDKWPDSVTHPRPVVARPPSGAAWVPAMKVATPRLGGQSQAPSPSTLADFDEF